MDSVVDVLVGEGAVVGWALVGYFALANTSFLLLTVLASLDFGAHARRASFRGYDDTFGTANGRRFLLMAGAGFDAHVVAAVRTPVKRWLGKCAYVLAMLQQLWRYGFERYRVTIDGAVHEVGSVLVANAHYYGGRFVAAPAADLQSSTLQVCLFERSGRLAAIGYALALFTGQLPRLASYRMLAAERLQIDGVQGEPVQADGDVIATLPARIEALPAALELIYPPDRKRTEARPAASAARPRPPPARTLEPAASEASR